MDKVKKICQQFLKLLFKPKSIVDLTQGAELCDVCHQPCFGWLGSKDENNNIKRVCIPCCELESKKYEYKWENKDVKNQTIDYNAYDKNGNKVNTLKVGYFTQEQIDELHSIQEKIYNEKATTQNS